MTKAVFDLCYFDEVAFDYEILIITDVTAAQLEIVIGNKSILAVDLSAKVSLETSAGEKVRMAGFAGTKANMLVASGSKSSIDIELLGGGL